MRFSLFPVVVVAMAVVASGRHEVLQPAAPPAEAEVPVAGHSGAFSQGPEAAPAAEGSEQAAAAGGGEAASEGAPAAAEAVVPLAGGAGGAIPPAEAPHDEAVPSHAPEESRGEHGEHGGEAHGEGHEGHGEEGGEEHEEHEPSVFNLGEHLNPTTITLFMVALITFTILLEKFLHGVYTPLCLISNKCF